MYTIAQIHCPLNLENENKKKICLELEMLMMNFFDHIFTDIKIWINKKKKGRNLLTCDPCSTNSILF